MKLLTCFSLQILALAAAQSALACGPIIPPAYQRSLLSANDYRGYPREVIEGAAAVLHGTLASSTNQNWDFSGQAGEDRFFSLVRELETLRRSLPAGAPFYVDAGYVMGSLIIVWNSATWATLNELPSHDRGYYRYIDLADGPTGVSILDEVTQSVGARTLRVGERSRNELSFDQIWLDHGALAARFRAAGSEVVDAGYAEYACEPIPALVRWVSKATYDYTDENQRRIRRFRVDTDTGTVTEL